MLVLDQVQEYNECIIMTSFVTNKIAVDGFNHIFMVDRHVYHWLEVTSISSQYIEISALYWLRI